MGIGSYDKKSTKTENGPNKNGCEEPDTCGKVEEGLIKESGCFLCGVETDDLCQDCGIETCSLHKHLHKGYTKEENGDNVEFCMPFRVTWREGVGRCVIATKDIQPLEINFIHIKIVVQDVPALTGPNYETHAVCVHCLGHHVECAVFSKLDHKLVANNITHGTIAYEYCSISVLRVLYLRDHNPEVWTRLNFLMDHDAERRQEELYWEMFQVNVVQFLRNKCKLQDKYSGKVIYPTFSFISHSCICNARYIQKEDDSIDVRAQTPIKKGEEITIQYITFLLGNMQRRTDIKACWMFECSCPRCKDPTEFGTYLSGMKCQSCSKVVLPISNRIDETEWKCISCDWSMTTEEVHKKFKELENEMLETYETDAERYLNLINQYSSVLWDTNCQMLLLKRYLATALSGKVTLEQIKMKLKLNDEFLRIFSIVDPGSTSWRAKHLCEVSQTKLFLADIQHSNDLISKEEFLTILKECIKDLEECIDHLRYETKGSKDFITRLKAKQFLVQATDILRFASFC